MKIILGILIVTLFSSVAFAQEVKFGDPAIQTVSVKISKNGDAHVIHEVQKSKNSQQVAFLSADFSDFTIIDDDGEEPQYAQAGGEKPGIVLFPTKNDVTIEYDVKGAIQQKNGLWTWNYVYLADSSFYLPDEVKLFYVNGNLVNLGDQKGFRCHGCQVRLEYELEPTIITKQVEWDGKKFDVKIITQTKIPSLKLDQPNKSLSFDVTEPNKYVTLIVPRELLWNPYTVSLNDKLILKQERIDQDNNVWLHITPNETGTVQITGVSVVPEFPLTAVLVLSAAMVVAIYANRLSHR